MALDNFSSNIFWMFIAVETDARVCAELPRNRNGLQEEFLQIDTRCMCYCMLRGARGVQNLAAACMQGDERLA